MNHETIHAFNQKNVETGPSPHGYGSTYFAKRNFSPGDEIMRGYGRIVDHQTSHKSVQIGPKKHYVPKKWTGAYWNHSCDPNMYMRTRQDGFPSLYALKKISKGTELSYNYAMSEFEWSTGADENHVACRCGSRNCSRKIRAFSQLTSREQRELIKAQRCARYLFSMVKLGV